MPIKQCTGGTLGGCMSEQPWPHHGALPHATGLLALQSCRAHLSALSAALLAGDMTAQMAHLVCCSAGWRHDAFAHLGLAAPGCAASRPCWGLLSGYLTAQSVQRWACI